MSKKWEYGESNNIIIAPPKQTLKISGHRLSTILGLNKYSTPFQAWCEITMNLITLKTKVIYSEELLMLFLQKMIKKLLL